MKIFGSGATRLEDNIPVDEQDKTLLQKTSELPGRFLGYATRGLPVLNPREEDQVSLATDVREVATGAASGLITQGKDILNLSTYIPSALGYGTAFAGESLGQGFSWVADKAFPGARKDKTEDDTAWYKSAHESGKYVFDKTNEFTDIQDFDFKEWMDDFTDPLMEQLEQKYKSHLRRPAEVAGEWVSPFFVAKGMKMGIGSLRYKRAAKAVNKFEKELKKQNPKLDPYDLSTAKTRKQALKEQDIEVKKGSDTAKTLQNIRAKEIQRDRIEYANLNDRNWRAMLRTEVPATSAAAMAVPYVETYYEDQAHYLAPLAGISLSLTAPATLGSVTYVYHGLFARAFNYRASKVVGNIDEKERLQDKATASLLKMQGIDASQMFDVSGRSIPRYIMQNGKKITNPEFRRRQKELLQTGEKNYRRFEKFAKILNEIDDPEQQEIIFDSIEEMSNLYEKFRIRAEKMGDPDLAESFIPLIHNVLELQALRGIQATLLSSVDMGWFASAKQVFKRSLKSDLDVLIENQSKQAGGIRASLLNLKKLTGSADTDSEIGIFIEETTRMLSDVSDELVGARQIQNASDEKTLGTALAKRLGATPAIQLKSDADSALAKIQKLVGVRGGKNVTEANKAQNILTGQILNTTYDTAREASTSRYEAAFLKDDGTDILVESDDVLDKIDDAISKRTGVAPQRLPGAAFLKRFKEQLQKTRLNNADTDDYNILVAGVSDITEKLLERIKKADPTLTEQQARGELRNQYGASILRFLNLETVKKQIQEGDPTKRRSIDNALYRVLMADDSILRKAMSDVEVRAEIGQDAQSLIDEYAGGAMKLRDLARYRREQMNKIVRGTPEEIEDATDVTNALNTFFDQLENSDDFLQNTKALNALEDANMFWKTNILPLRAGSIQKQIQTEKTLKAREGITGTDRDDPETIQKLLENIEGTGVWGKILDPSIEIETGMKLKSVEQGVIGIEQTLRGIIQNYAVDVNGKIDPIKLKEIKDSVRRGLLSEIGTQFTKSAMSRKIDAQYLNMLENIKLANGTTINMLEDASDKKSYKDFKDSLYKVKEYFEHTKAKQNQEASDLLNAVQKDVDVLIKRGDSFAGSVLNSIQNAVGKEIDPLKQSELFADIFIGAGQQSTGFRFTGKTIDLNEQGIPKDKRIQRIESLLTDDEAKRFRGIIRGESTGLSVVDSQGERFLLEFPEDVNTPLERAMFEIDFRIQRGTLPNGNLNADGEVAQRLKNSINDIVINSIASKAFHNAGDVQTKSNRLEVASYTNGRIFDGGSDFVLDANTLQDTVRDYEPYFRIAFKQPDGTYNKKFINPETGAEEVVNVLEELNDIVRLGRASAKTIGQTEKITGIDYKRMPFKSALAKAFAWRRGVVSGQWLLGEQLIQNYKAGEADILRKFLTDPSAVHALHDVFVKGRISTSFQKPFLRNMFSERTLAILFERMRDEDFNMLGKFFGQNSNEQDRKKRIYPVPEHLKDASLRGIDANVPIDTQMNNLRIS